MGIRRSRFCGTLPSPSQPAIPRPTCAREPAPLRSGSARPCMRHTLSRPHLPVATDATSADFPRAVCRRKALKGERGPTPLHPGGPSLGGPTSSASSTRRLQVCRIATPSPIPSPSSHPSLPFPPSMPLPCHRASPRPHPAPRHPLGMSLFLRPPSLSSLPSLPPLPSAIARLSRWWFGAR